jgi:hypothetical protein
VLWAATIATNGLRASFTSRNAWNEQHYYFFIMIHDMIPESCGAEDTGLWQFCCHDGDSARCAHFSAPGLREEPPKETVSLLKDTWNVCFSCARWTDTIAGLLPALRSLFRRYKAYHDSEQSSKFASLRRFSAPMSSARRNPDWARRPSSSWPVFSKSSPSTARPRCW